MGCTNSVPSRWAPLLHVPGIRYTYTARVTRLVLHTLRSYSLMCPASLVKIHNRVPTDAILPACRVYANLNGCRGVLLAAALIDCYRNHGSGRQAGPIPTDMHPPGNDCIPTSIGRIQRCGERVGRGIILNL